MRMDTKYVLLNCRGAKVFNDFDSARHEMERQFEIQLGIEKEHLNLLKCLGRLHMFAKSTIIGENYDIVHDWDSMAIRPCNGDASRFSEWHIVTVNFIRDVEKMFVSYETAYDNGFINSLPITNVYIYDDVDEKNKFLTSRVNELKRDGWYSDKHCNNLNKHVILFSDKPNNWKHFLEINIVCVKRDTEVIPIGEDLVCHRPFNYFETGMFIH